MTLTFSPNGNYLASAGTCTNIKIAGCEDFKIVYTCLKRLIVIMYEILPGKSRDWYKIAASIDLQTITFN